MQLWDRVRSWGIQLASQERAMGNARRATTEMSRRRVERDEVTLYLEELAGPHRLDDLDDLDAGRARGARAAES